MQPKPKVIPKSRAHVDVPSFIPAREEGPALPSCPGRRPQATISKIVEAEVPPSPPKPARPAITEKEKDRLAHRMAFGEDPPLPPPKRVALIPPYDPDPERTQLEAMFDEVRREIRERKEFLEEMRRLGKADKFEPKLQLEIQDRIREMKRLDADIKKLPSSRPRTNASEAHSPNPKKKKKEKSLLLKL